MFGCEIETKRQKVWTRISSSLTRDQVFLTTLKKMSKIKIRKATSIEKWEEAKKSLRIELIYPRN